MLESLISSRIRRVLVEYLIKYPENRFYLRGLAKELNLAISPLRRELKKLEQAGLLRAYQEGNILFYVVDQSNPLFVQLCQMLSKPEVAAPEVQSFQPSIATEAKREKAQQEAIAPIEAKSELLVNKKTAFGIRQEVIFALSFVSIFLLVGSGIIYFAALKQNPFSMKNSAIVHSTKKVNAVKGNLSGQMHSSNWRVMPGVAGGFGSGSGARQENY